MKRPLWLPLTLLALLTLLIGARGSRQRTDARADLTRPGDAVDPNAKGRVEVRSRRGRERLVLQAERLTPGDTIQFLIEDAGSTLQVVGTDEVDSRGQARVSWDTKSQSLPLAAAAIADLAGRAVEVRVQGGGRLLVGSVPGLPGQSSDGDDDDDNGQDDDDSNQGGGDSRSRFRARGPLDNVDLAFAPTGKGKVDVDYRPLEGRSKLGFEVENVPSGATFDLFLENPANGQLEKAGILTVNSAGEAELEFETEDGAPLPFGVTGADDFFGREVEVRRIDGTVQFHGVIPTP